jgi:hypothetical protein
MRLTIDYVVMGIKPSAFPQKHLIIRHVMTIISATNQFGQTTDLFNRRIHLS